MGKGARVCAPERPRCRPVAPYFSGACDDAARSQMSKKIFAWARDDRRSYIPPLFCTPNLSQYGRGGKEGSAKFGHVSCMISRATFATDSVAVTLDKVSAYLKCCLSPG